MFCPIDKTLEDEDYLSPNSIFVTDKSVILFGTVVYLILTFVSFKFGLESFDLLKNSEAAEYERYTYHQSNKEPLEIIEKYDETYVPTTERE